MHWGTLRNLPLFENVDNDKMLVMTASKSVPLLRSHELQVTGNSEPERAAFSWLCSVFILMGTIIFATDCVSPLLWMLVNLQPNLKLISSSWIVSYDIHYVLSNLLSLYPIFSDFIVPLLSFPHLYFFLNLSHYIHADRRIEMSRFQSVS